MSTRTEQGITGAARLPEEEQLTRLLQHAGVSRQLLRSIPIDIELIAHRIGAESVKHVEIPFDGMLTPNINGFTIYVNSANRYDRRRFTCAHEIAHALLSPMAGPALRLGGPVSSDQLEKKCERLASMLLMPNPVFREQANSGIASISIVMKLAHTFLTSIQATALRFVQEVTEQCVMIISKPSPREAEGGLRVKWSSHNVTRRTGQSAFFVPRRASLNINTSAVAYRTNIVQSAVETVTVGSLRVTACSESKGFGTGDSRYVLTLVFPDRTH